MISDLAGFRMDPAICDSCLHLSAVPCSKAEQAEGVPVACQAVSLPHRSSTEFSEGFASAIPGSMQWSCCQGNSQFSVAGLTSKVLASSGAEQSAAALTRQVS